MDVNQSCAVPGGEVRKIYYSIGEVCSRTGLEPHVLRYWENEFQQLRPKKNRAGNRAYREKDIETVTFIKRLLYEEQYTIPGAKKKLSDLKSGESPAEKQTDLFNEEKVNRGDQDLVRGLQDVLKILRS